MTVPTIDRATCDTCGRPIFLPLHPREWRHERGEGDRLAPLHLARPALGEQDDKTETPVRQLPSEGRRR